MRWIRQCDKYFELARVPEENRSDLAVSYMTGRADKWLRGSGLLANPVTWSILKLRICDRFAAHSIYDIIEEFHAVQQHHSSVAHYIDKFEELMAIMRSENPMLREDYFVKCFVKGLREDIKHYVKPHRPQSLCEAYWMSKDLRRELMPIQRDLEMDLDQDSRGVALTKKIFRNLTLEQ